MARGAAHYETVTRRDLSPRQREVLELIAAGKTNGEIAERLGITLDGAKWHVSEILGKLGVETREDAAAWWQARRGVGARMGSWARALAPLWTWKVAAPVAVGGAVAVAAFAWFGRGDGQQQALSACTGDDIILEATESGLPADQVVVVLTARSRERPCALVGMASAFLDFPTNRLDGTVEALLVDVQLGMARTELLHLRWVGSCKEFGERVDAHGSITLPGASQPAAIAGPVFLVHRPPCGSGAREPSNPLAWGVVPAAASSFSPDLGPDPFTAIACYPSDPNSKWQKPCAVADRIQPGLTGGNVDAIIESAELTEFVCPESGSGGIGGPWTLCEGASAREARSGVPVVFHGSAGDVLQLEQLRVQLETMVQSAKNGQLYGTRVASVACFDVACQKFALGIANDGNPAAAYLVYLSGEAVPRLISVGFAGDVALEIRRGGTVRVDGPMEFVPLIPPY